MLNFMAFYLALRLKKRIALDLESLGFAALGGKCSSIY
jgi:hypothetical protein